MEVLSLITALLTLLKPNLNIQGKRQDRKNLKFVEKRYRRLRRRYRKHGFESEEIAKLSELENVILTRTKELLK